MPSRAPRASRRAVLAAGAGAVLLAGCGARESDAGASADPTAPPVDADSDLVEEVVGQLEAAAATATATGREYAALRPLARRLEGLHRSHLEELGRDPRSTPGRVPRLPVADARVRLLRAEERLQQRLVVAAVEAESGALAQVFASMAAAVAQQRVAAG